MCNTVQFQGYKETPEPPGEYIIVKVNPPSAIKFMPVSRNLVNWSLITDLASFRTMVAGQDEVSRISHCV